ncbi:cytochrome P450 [Aspergillus avenaceus]|uniref:Cytochrome P450 n=1 Tax=Aspergillus avenaceus TaxID=36643 RepID=A0A5N6TZM6_ASPAV|nr:cytochrome P450 [Aspergillus avenaceus]
MDVEGQLVPKPVYLWGVLAVLTLLLYCWLLPSPIPGIPRNESLGILGDMPSMLRYARRTGEPTAWFREQTEKLQAPLVQVFLRPFSKPFLVLADFRESQDIMMRRKDFDRSRFTNDLMGGPAPNHHIIQPTNGVWKAHRRLLQDLMTPSYLGMVGLPAVYGSALNLVKLWKVKAALAQGRPFSARGDMFFVTLDAILGFSFGDAFQHSAMRPQLDLLGSMMSEESDRLNREDGEGRDVPVEFPEAPLNEYVDAILNAGNILEALQSSIVPKLTYWWLSRKRAYRRAHRVKDDYIRHELEQAVRRLEERKEDEEETWVRSAVDLMVARERKFAAQDGRTPEYYSGIMLDEIFGFVVAGHDTTSTTLLWGLKFLTANPHVQVRLRERLHAAYPSAAAEKRTPSMQEIAHTTVPYLDATVEEMLRCAKTAPAITREATVDTQLLGYPVPKGTNVFMLSNGASFFTPSFEIDESKRSKASRAAKVRKLDESSDMAAFAPERWLVYQDGQETYDATAGPQLVFGLGTRGCYGRRLAYLEMKVLVTLIVWTFELSPVPASLASDAAVDGLSHQPRECYVRLREVV